MTRYSMQMKAENPHPIHRILHLARTLHEQAPRNGPFLQIRSVSPRNRSQRTCLLVGTKRLCEKKPRSSKGSMFSVVFRLQ